MPGIRALAGYMDAFVGAEEAEQDRMLQEMKQVLEVGKGLTTMQATQQTTRIAGAEEARTAAQAPYKLEQVQMVTENARRMLDELDEDIAHKRAMEAPELQTAIAGATTAGVGAQYAERAEIAKVGQLEDAYEKSKMETAELTRQLEASKSALAKFEGMGMPTPTEAEMGTTIGKYRQFQAVLEAELEYDVVIKKASAAATAAERKQLVDQIMIDHPEYTEDQILGSIELEAAQAAKLRAEAKASGIEGEAAKKRFDDYFQMAFQTAKFLAQVKGGMSVADAAKIWSTDNPIYVQIFPLLRNEKTAPVEVEEYFRVLKKLMLREFEFDYDKWAAEEPVPIPEFYYQPGQAPRVPTPTPTPAPAPTAAPGTIKWDVDNSKILEGLRGGTSQ